jgi:uncharacterized protein with PIN domain
MAVVCPGCGRSYPEARFAFGRTLDCTCGTRVRLGAPDTRAGPAEVRFAADAMLGRLARWLRLIGCDTLFDAAASDAQLVRSALQEGRVLLTRDRRLPQQWSVPQVLVVRAERLPAQLREVVEHFGLDWRSRRFTRCSRCNAPLEAATADQIARGVPARVADSAVDFRRCARCQRVYWPGSHVERMERALEAALGASPATRAG